jgi:Uri superfamily endonuclease
MEGIAKRSIGTYVLVLHLEQPKVFQIGQLGLFPLQAGFYTYVGSAMGAGGLAARLGHHLRISARPHWHIDYLRQIAAIEQIWFLESPARREHDWAALLRDMPGASILVPRFGASDCRCASHLYYFSNLPAVSEFQNQNARRFPGDGQIGFIEISS